MNVHLVINSPLIFDDETIQSGKQEKETGKPLIENYQFKTIHFIE